MHNGEVVVIENFFVQDAEGNRSDLVLEDEAGVYWWGQYTSPWSEFHFTEIETHDPIAPWWWLLPGLGGLAAVAGGGGGSSSSDKRPEPPVVEVNDVNVVIDPTTGDTALITGKLNFPSGTVPNTVTVTINGKKYPAEVDENGNWKVTVPVGELTTDTPIQVTGTVRDPKTG